MAALEGQVILNTRPAHQQAELTALLEADGATVLSFPAIAIVAPEATEFHHCLAQSVADYDLLLFVSRNAVDGAFRYFAPADLSADARCGAIGTATLAALQARLDGREAVIASPPYNSEALLAAPELQRVDGQRVLIFRGQPGRNLLGDELERRGAAVDFCEVYRRALPPVEPEAFDRLTAAAWPRLVVLTSEAGMRNLLQLVDAAAARRLCATPWLLISERMRESANKLGHNADIVVAQSASDDGIHQSIRAWVEPQ